MFTLARETGWNEAFLIWELPLPRALQYYHCALRSALAWTVEPGPGAVDQLRRLEALVAPMLSGVDEEFWVSLPVDCSG